MRGKSLYYRDFLVTYADKLWMANHPVMSQVYSHKSETALYEMIDAHWERGPYFVSVDNVNFYPNEDE